MDGIDRSGWILPFENAVGIERRTQAFGMMKNINNQ